MYDPRIKAQWDYEWAMAAAREEGFQEGLQKAREEREKSELMKCMLEGKIQILQEFLGERALAIDIGLIRGCE